MSKAPAKVEESSGGDDHDGEEAPKKGKKKLLIIIVAVVVLAIGAGLYFSGILGGGAPAEGEEEAAAAEESSGHGEKKEEGHGEKKEEGGHGKAKEPGGHGDKKEGHAKMIGAPVYYELPQFLVNLTSTTGRPSFIKISVTFELKDEETVALMDANKPRIQDTFNTYLRELRASDVQGSAGIYRLRAELMTRLNATLGEGMVKDVLFGEIIVQ